MLRLANPRAKVEIMADKRITRVRKVLRVGSLVFGLSALTLIVVPGFFNQLLGFSTNSELEWAMRMIGITLVALAGNMYSVSRGGSDDSVLLSGKVMLISAGALGVLTLLIPAPLGWFTIAYAAVGFGFSAAYFWALRK